MKPTLFALVLALTACDFNPNAAPQTPEHDGPAFHIHGFPVYSVVYYGNHCFLIDFHDPKVPQVGPNENSERFSFACSGH